MWWPRLLRSHAAIQWDDYEKDYTDLPPQVPSCIHLLPLCLHLSLAHTVTDNTHMRGSSDQQSRAHMSIVMQFSTSEIYISIRRDLDWGRQPGSKSYSTPLCSLRARQAADAPMSCALLHVCMVPVLRKHSGVQQLV